MIHCSDDAEDVTDDIIDDSTNGDLVVSSIAIVNGELLDAFKCEQGDPEASIPLAWTGVPSNAGSLAITMIHYANPDDQTKASSYLLLWDIDPSVTNIAHGAADDGDWFMGSDKDGVAISYTSPCSPSSGSHEYEITVYALSETPSSLPSESTLAVDYSTLTTALSTVDVISSGTLTFNDVTE